MPIPDTPLFVKTHDFIVWLIRHTQRFAKNLRHSYTNRLESAAFDFEQALLSANVCRGPQRDSKPVSRRSQPILGGRTSV